MFFNNYQDLLNPENFKEIIKKRDECESARLREIEEKKISHLEFLDNLFEKFSLEYGRIKDSCRYLELNETTDNIKTWFALMDLKENWAFWLEHEDFLATDSFQSHKDVDAKFRNFCSSINGIQNLEIKQNPFYAVCLANEYLEREINCKNKERAESELKNALVLGGSDNDCALLYPVYLKLFEVEIESGCQMFERYINAFQDILKKLPDLTNYVNLIKTIWEVLKKAVESLKNEDADNQNNTALKKKLNEAIKLIENALKSLNPKGILDIHEKLKEIIKSSWDFIKNVLKNINRGYIENAREFIGKARNGLEAEEGYLKSMLKSDDEKEPSKLETILSFSQRDDSSSSGENFLFKHLLSRHIILSVYLENVKSLEDQISEFVKTGGNDLAYDEFGDPVLRKLIVERDFNIGNRREEGGLMIGTRVSGYLRKLDSSLEHEKRLKENITESEIKELENIGMGIIYQMRIVYNVSGEVIDYARGQIVIGLSLIGKF